MRKSHGAGGLDLKRKPLVLASLLAVSVPSWGASPPPAEYEVKAAFLFNFAKFVEWPPEAFPSGGDFNVCILGGDPFGKRLEVLLADKTVHDRALAVKRLKDPEGAGGCQLLFIGGG